MDHTNTADLEHDLLQNPMLVHRVREDNAFAQALYAALCNNQFQHRSMTPTDRLWTCTWRYAGGLVADIRNAGGDYIDYYCSGGEGRVNDDVRLLLEEMGWVVVPYSDDNKER